MKIPNNVAHSLQNESGTTTIKSFRFSEKLLEKLSFRNSNETDKIIPDLINYYLTNSIDDLK